MKIYEHNTISVFPSQKAGGYNKGSKTAGTKKPGRLLKERENVWKRKASFVGRLLSENQMSEAFINSMFLALSAVFRMPTRTIAEMKYSQMPRRETLC